MEEYGFTGAIFMSFCALWLMSSCVTFILSDMTFKSAKAKAAQHLIVVIGKMLVAPSMWITAITFVYMLLIKATM